VAVAVAGSGSGWVAMVLAVSVGSGSGCGFWIGSIGAVLSDIWLVVWQWGSVAVWLGGSRDRGIGNYISILNKKYLKSTLFFHQKHSKTPIFYQKSPISCQKTLKNTHFPSKNTHFPSKNPQKHRISHKTPPFSIKTP
jgi:hypothetical protein